MSPSVAPLDFFKLLAHELRWQIIQGLALSDLRVNELVSMTGEPMNLVSYHLRMLRNAGVVVARRSDADRRDVYYGLDMNSLREMYFEGGQAIHISLGATPHPLPVQQAPPTRVLFVCTHNSARSQMAEALLRARGGISFEVFSAGNQPSNIRPEVTPALAPFGVALNGQYSKPLTLFSGQAFDYVITVCDTAREVCPTFEGRNQKLHWGYADPTNIADDAQRQTAFTDIAEQLHQRILLFIQNVQHHHS